ncbi:hypothetical protein SAMN05421823_103491 [Catalinimonas alkaloidigena]|uniref:Uncharacterized protein n=1 Tax=Catalinimonas alkaloidigena TaxID=1075417 RepID=A0A1G9EJ28_9BACT|nr:hypothetical protein SAMN05421823_103491 [Catalinimonas alkaloidigena]
MKLFYMLSLYSHTMPLFLRTKAKEIRINNNYFNKNYY